MMPDRPKVINQATVSSDGSLLFPHRGNPPKAVPGYQVDPGDPYIFKLIEKPCKFRGCEWKKVCGGMYAIRKCQLLGINPTVPDCVECKLNG